MSEQDASLRLFVALELPDVWKEALAALQQEMRAGLQQRFGDSVRPRWVRPEGIHLTLKFLGQTPETRLDSLRQALTRAVPAPPGFNLSLARIGSFEERRAPRVILATVAGEAKAVLALVESIETWLAAAGWPREKRSFRAHLTLARLPETLDDATRRSVAEITAAYTAPAVPPWHVESVSLMRSYVGPGGARYERLASFPGPG